jgi:phosphopantothenoylcysteine decarboxylase
MNTAMWNHPITARQIASLKDFGYVEIPCIAKKLVCGDEGLFVCVCVCVCVAIQKADILFPQHKFT